MPKRTECADFLSKLKHAWQRWELLQPRVLVGVSGGPDSVALLLGLQELQVCLHAVHVHHGWRGAEADADAAWVIDWGNRIGIPTEVVTISPDQKASQAGKSLEESARASRYELLIDAARKAQCSLLAVGHTADDQVETVLHHILRGTGLAGLAGMPRERQLTHDVCLVRPLLELSRANVETYLAERGQPFRVDATNEDVSLTRNRLRHELLPYLRTAFNPRVDAALSRLSDQSAEINDVLNELTTQLLRDVTLDENDVSCRLDANKLARSPDPLIREILRKLWIQRAWPRQEMGQREWQRLVDIVHHRGAIDLPGGISARLGTGPLILWKR